MNELTDKYIYIYIYIYIYGLGSMLLYFSYRDGGK